MNPNVNVSVVTVNIVLFSINYWFGTFIVIDGSGLEDISPAASAATNLISKGLSLTQLYTEYMNVSEKLHAAEEENKRLHRYVDGIVEVKYLENLTLEWL